MIRKHINPLPPARESGLFSFLYFMPRKVAICLKTGYNEFRKRRRIFSGNMTEPRSLSDEKGALR